MGSARGEAHTGVRERPVENHRGRRSARRHRERFYAESAEEHLMAATIVVPAGRLPARNRNTQPILFLWIRLAPGPRGHRLDVVIHSEEVGWVVFVLDRA